MAKGRRARPLSVGTALTEAVGLVTSRPASVLVWGLAAGLLIYGPLAAFAGVLIPFYADLFTGAGVETAVRRVSAIQAPLQLVSTLSQCAAYAVVGAAAFRAILSPKERGAFGLRLGMAELRQAFVYLCVVVLVVLVAIAAALIFGVVALVAGLAVQTAGGETGGYLFPGILLLAAVVYATMLWFFLRLSMAGPMTFAEGKFRLFESFRITRGRVWRLLGLAVVVYVLTLIFYATAFLLAAGVVLLLGFGGGFQAAFSGLDRLSAEEVLQRVAPYLVAFWAVAALAFGPAMALWFGSFASAYRQLTSGSEEAR